MSGVTVDDRGPLTIPKEHHLRATRAAVIPSGPFLIIIPLPMKSLEASGGWLRSKLERKELKASAEKTARKDAVRRAKRTRQLSDD